MKKLGCTKCGGKTGMSLSKAKLGMTTGDDKKKKKKNQDSFAPQTVSIIRNGKVVYQEKPSKGDKGDSGSKYRYKSGGATAPLETRIPSGVTGPNMSPRVMREGGPFSPEARATRKAKRTERKITKQIKKSVMNSGKVIKAKRGGIKK